MAVADLGLAIGPRNRRRITRGAIVAGLVVATAATLVLLVRRSHHAGPGPSAASSKAPARPVTVTSKLVYGMSKGDVLRLAGRPARSVGPCWQYQENLKIWQGKHTVNAERVCFLGGTYSYAYSEIDGKWIYPTTLRVPGHA